MKIIEPRDQPGPAPNQGSRYTGDVFSYVTLETNDGVKINTVTFAPGARTYWHTHEHGQILQVISGRGLIQVKGGPVRALRAGDTVWTPADEEHWHGAAGDSMLSHVAISLGAAAWRDEVTAAEYEAEAVSS